MTWLKHTFKITNKTIKTKLLTEKEINQLIIEFPFNKTKDLSKKYNCSKSFLDNFARYYGIKKNTNWLKSLKADILINRNKNLIGRDLTEELLKESALKYNTKREFQDKDASAYTTANKLGIMNEITSHMVNISFSVPQIITRQITEYLFKQKCEYNTRKIISPYELDIYFPALKIAFEYDGKGWHQNDKIDKFTLCRDKDILLITLSERNRKFKEDITNYIIENLNLINDWCKTIITQKDVLEFNEPIDFPLLFTEEDLYILRNNTTTFLIKNYSNLYQKYRKYNPDNKIFTTLIWSEEICIETINKYDNVGELFKNEPKVYFKIHKTFRHLLPLYNN